MTERTETPPDDIILQDDDVIACLHHMSRLMRERHLPPSAAVACISMAVAAGSEFSEPERRAWLTAVGQASTMTPAQRVLIRNALDRGKAMMQPFAPGVH